MRHESNPVDALRAFVRQAGSQRTAAAELGVSQAYISDMLRGNRNISDAILNKLGLRRVVVRTR